MNDQEASNQVQQMVNFIMQEAKQSAEEVTAKATEDFNIEKLKMVQGMKDKLRSEMAVASKKVETAAAIQKSTMVNKARLRKIEARQGCFDKLSGEVCDKLREVAKAESKYKQIVIDLIVQGSLKLMEDEVVVKCRAADANIVRGVLEQASQAFTKTVAKATNVQTRLRLSLHKDVLPPTCLGGVVLSSANGAISVDNTLDTRLKLCMDNDKPAIRKMLFP